MYKLGTRLVVTFALMWTGYADALSAADRVIVHFDAPSMATAADVTHAEFQLLNPLEKLVAVRIDVSLLTTSHQAHAVDEVVYYLQAVEQRAQVVDYAPKTTAVSDILGPIHVSTESKSGSGIQLSAGAQLDQVLNGDASISNSTNQSALETYERLPNRDVVATSGTIGRGSGVYFKLRRHSQLAIEGEHHLVMVMRVPLNWRADYLRLVCRAYGGDGRHQPQLLANESLLVPIYLDGDLVARNLAAHLLNAQHALIQIAESQHREIEKRRLPTLVHELSLADPKIPKDWVETVLWSTAETNPPDFQGRLPKSVQHAIGEYRAAQQALVSWNGSPEIQSQPVASTATAAAADRHSVPVAETVVVRKIVQANQAWVARGAAQAAVELDGSRGESD